MKKYFNFEKQIKKKYVNLTIDFILIYFSEVKD